MAVHGGNVDEIARKYKYDPMEIIDFSANINPLGLNENIKSSMIKAVDKVIKYPDITYFNLKNSIGEFESISSNNIILGNGAAEVIFNIIRALNPKKALLPAPTFSEYEEAILSIGGDIEYFHLKEEESFILNNKFIESINENIDITFICNPNNPTGALTDKEFIEKVLRKSLDTNTIVVIDESFLDFVKDNINYSSKELLNQYNNLIIVKSLTKFFAMPGARIGYGICSNKNIIHKINKVMVPWTVNIMATEGIIQGLKEKDYIENSIEYVNDEKEYLYSALKEISFIKVFEPSVNFIMFKILKNIDLKYELLRKKILIRSCDNYIGLNNSFYRVAVRNREENNELIRQLKNILFDK
ncbi:MULTISPECIES: threonine-phosphate decarboxylase CobD [unclassified Clostridium]|uniref:threonine-phosphate decarboxylase CobD n=1 Tax=Clostridium TaxID=1485 RepID=UPI001C8BBEAF|nr:MULTISPECIES: threonine-phosphate decarboxylase CobD [unclassified Clostridium]MBX9137715.1 threonine-phosphate decarboxylase [Clostridium sp. K12(2020)]MBX9144660.1 threonine-phosphate decarboxylase [Clostridium sp. K13]MDU2290452.1 threonine-phosphate decarboxylase CobD [Clostridium celatum]MDU4325092.1 threonine-phosphate decarboxylase CobD [Clostridium celatum]